MNLKVAQDFSFLLFDNSEGDLSTSFTAVLFIYTSQFTAAPAQISSKFLPLPKRLIPHGPYGLYFLLLFHLFVFHFLDLAAVHVWPLRM